MKSELYDSRIRISVRATLARYIQNPSEGLTLRGENYTRGNGIRGRKLSWFVDLPPYGEPIQPEPTDLPFTRADIRTSVDRSLKKRVSSNLYSRYRPTIEDRLGSEQVKAIRERVAA